MPRKPKPTPLDKDLVAFLQPDDLTDLGLSEAAIQAVSTRLLPRYVVWLQTEGWLRKGAGSPGPTPEELAQVQYLWDLWKSLRRKPVASAQAGRSRTQKALRLLRSGQTRDDLALVIRWAAQDRWLSGQDPKSHGRDFLEWKTIFGPDNYERYILEARAWDLGGVNTAGPVRSGRRL
jgi:hypothetical protein